MEEGDSVAQGAVLARIDAAGQQASRSAGGRGAGRRPDRAGPRPGCADPRARRWAPNIARTELEAAERALQTAMQDVARATAQVDQAQVIFDNHTIRAPMAGTILVLNVDPGQSIDTATVLMTIADLDDLIVEADVDEAYATRITTGLPALLQLAGEDAPRAGRVDFVSQRVDAATGGLSLRLGFDAPVRAPVGLTVTTNIIVDERAEAITVPRAAVSATTDGAVVFVVHNDVAEARAVTVIDWPAARLIVTEGLAPGDAAGHGRHGPCRRAVGAGHGALMLYALKIADPLPDRQQGADRPSGAGGGGGRLHLHLHVGADRGAGGIHLVAHRG